MRLVLILLPNLFKCRLGSDQIVLRFGQIACQQKHPMVVEPCGVTTPECVFPRCRLLEIGFGLGSITLQASNIG
jgi:hypothetical protein